MALHAYRFRIYEADDTTTDVTIDEGAIEELPASFGAQRIDVLQGSSEYLNWTIKILQQLTVAPVTTFSQYLSDTGGRAVLLQRRVALLRAPDGYTFGTVAGGRILNISQNADTLTWSIEVGDERWIERNTLTFTKADTTKVYPPGTIPEKSWWTDYSVELRGTPSTYTGPNYSVGVALSPTYKLPGMVASVINEDIKPGTYYYDPNWDGTPYRTLRFRIGGSTHDYEVVGGGQTNPLSAVLYPEWKGGEERTQTWVRDDPGTPMTRGVEQDCYFYTPLASASKRVPLHIGDNFPVGIHPFQLLKNLYDGQYQVDEDVDTGAALSVRTVRYSTQTMADLIADPGVVPSASWQRITKPESIASAAERLVYRPTGYVPALDNSGAVKPVRTRLPGADTVPSTTGLYEFNASNATLAPTWDHKSKDQVTAIRFQYTNDVNYLTPSSTDPVRANSLDHIEAEQFSFERRSKRLDAGDVVRREVSMELPGVRNIVLAEPYADVFAADTFARYEDGPQYSKLHAMTGASTVTVGDLVVVNVDTFPNTYAQTRGGKVLMQVTSRAVTPTGYTLDLLHVGPDLLPISAPTLTLNRSTGDPTHSIVAQIAGGTTNESAELQFSKSSSAGAYRTVATAAYGESVAVGELASGTQYWGRARLQRANRIRSDWSVADSTSTEAMTAPSALASTAWAENWAQLTWTNGEAAERVQVQNSTQGVFANLLAGSNQYRVRGLEPDYSYVFRVRHKDDFGGFSAYSTNAFVTTSTAGSTEGTPLAVLRPNWLAIAQGENIGTQRTS